MKTSKGRILDYLTTHKEGLTSLEAYQMFGTTRLSARIHNLRKNHNIETVMQEWVNRYGETVSYARYYYRGKKEVTDGK